MKIQKLISGGPNNSGVVGFFFQKNKREGGGDGAFIRDLRVPVYIFRQLKRNIKNEEIDWL